MIDFENGSVFKLRRVKGFPSETFIGPLLVPGEQFIGEYQTVRDYVVFTNKRILSVNVQGITGKKKDCTILPYSRIQAFSIETSGVIDMDSELDLYFSGLGHVHFEFTGGSDILQIGQMISRNIL